MRPSRWCSVVLLIAVAIVAAVLPGCVGMGFNYAPSRDTVVIRLDAGGNQEWVRTLDSGQDDVGEDMAELANGELVVVGQNGTSRRTLESPRVVRLSPDGRVIEDRTGADRFDRPRAVVADPDGGFAVLMQGGEVTRFDRTGAALWTSASALWDTPSLTRLRDGGYLVGGYTVHQVFSNNTSVPEKTLRPPARTAATPGSAAPSGSAAPRTPSPTGAGGGLADLTAIPIPSYTPPTLVQKAAAARYSPDGRLIWERTYDEGIGAVYAALDDRAGGLLLAGPAPDTSAGRDRTLELVVLRADDDGAPRLVTALGQAESFHGAVRIRAVRDGTEVLFSTWRSGVQNPEFGIASALLDQAGQVIREQALKGSRVFNGTSDGGYVSVGVPFVRGVESYDSSLSSGNGQHLYTTFHALRFDVGGAPVWNRPLSIGSIDDVRRVIQTADGGFAILATTEKR